jgi:asparagine synthase (glutamine-hydrolysing)
MCGITGFVDLSASTPREQLLESVRHMSACIVHRGPDDSGEWADERSGVALGFRRLSILDLSPAGHQPMISASGRYVIIFNGEVYNFEQIRSELVSANAAPDFRGHSDTEVLLAAIEAWGVESAVRKFVGMFAFALWDREERELVLGRDRVGVKPLYYGVAGGTLLFGSELKPLRRHPRFDATLDRDALALYMRHNCIPAPHSVYRGIRKLEPGTIVKMRGGKVGEPQAYWSAREVAIRGVASPFAGSDAEAESTLDSLLRESVGLRMIADVPLGVFLSGGIDSSVVAAMMQASSSTPVKTFTIGFREDAFNEADHARQIARHLGTDHTELYVTPQETLDVIPRLPSIYDEPFADSSQIPTLLVSQLARRHVTVSLSGDGGDELFGGYNRYLVAARIWRAAERLPATMRRMSAAAMRGVSPAVWDALVGLLPGTVRGGITGDRIHKFAGVIDSRTVDEVYWRLVSHWERPADVVRGATEPATVVSDSAASTGLADAIDRMMYRDLVTYLADDILVKVDRASMAVSLEAREPLLDHRLIEFAWTLPRRLKIRDGEGKWLLRRVLERYVPARYFDRPKMGFGVPLDRWLRGPLREWAEDLLAARELESHGLLDAEPVRRAWQEHLSGRRNWQYQLWDVLMLQAWLREQRRSASDIGPC